MSTPRRFALIGQPVAHSLSPRIHARFAEQCGIEIDYTLIDADAGEFEATVRDFFAGGGTGLNVTQPHKEAAFALCEITSPAARLAGAVNTLLPGAKSTLIGENTDGSGLRRDLENNLEVTLRGATVLVLGAGGAARGIVGVLLLRRPAALVIANRGLERARALTRRFLSDQESDADRGQTESGVELSAASFANPGTAFDLVVNATSAGHAGEAPDVPDAALRGALAYDLQYGEAARPFMQRASKAGARAVHDGLGLLVEQAAESFFVWNDERPETASVLAELRKD